MVYAMVTPARCYAGGVSEAKRQGHAEAIKTEVAVLRALEGTLNVARLDSVYEDEHNVHAVMEYCSGGELWHAIGKSHYSERTVRENNRQGSCTVCKASGLSCRA